MAEMTDGQHLKLSEFSTLCDTIMAICYREKGAEFLSVSTHFISPSIALYFLIILTSAN
jgi:hypothetical protein